MPFTLLIREGVFSTLAVPQGLLVCNLDHTRPGTRGLGCLMEQDVNFFETTTSGFRLEHGQSLEITCSFRVTYVEKIDDRDDSSVDDCKDDISPVADVVESDGRNEHDDEVTEPVSSR
jgi:hypothetical protein